MGEREKERERSVLRVNFCSNLSERAICKQGCNHGDYARVKIGGEIRSAWKWNKGTLLWKISRTKSGEGGNWRIMKDEEGARTMVLPIGKVSSIRSGRKKEKMRDSIWWKAEEEEEGLTLLHAIFISISSIFHRALQNICDSNPESKARNLVFISLFKARTGNLMKTRSAFPRRKERAKNPGESGDFRSPDKKTRGSFVRKYENEGVRFTSKIQREEGEEEFKNVPPSPNVILGVFSLSKAFFLMTH